MQNCVSHKGLYDDDDNPLDAKGNLYRPGVRLCRKRDCVNQMHIQGFKRTRTLGKPVSRYSQADYDEILLIGNSEAVHKRCQFSKCDKKKQARNLCRTHWRIWHHRNKGKDLKPRLTLQDFPKVPEPKPKGWRLEPVEKRKCILEKCNNTSRKRSLCSTHYNTYNRLIERELWKSIQSA